MKNTNLAFLIILLAILFSGCVTPQPGPGPNPPLITTDQAIQDIQDIVPLAVAIELVRAPQERPYFIAVADVIGVAARNTNTTPATLMADIKKLNAGPEAQVIALGTLTAWKLFVAQQIGFTNGSDSKRILIALSDAIKEGAGSTPEQLRSRNAIRHSKLHSSVQEPNPIYRTSKAIAAPFKEPVAEDPFSGNELTFGIAGTYTASESGVDKVFHNDISKGKYGLAIETTYWMSKYFGAGAEAYIVDITNPGPGLFNAAGLTASVRYPIGHVAPYGQVAIDRDWGTGYYDTTARIGLAVRLTGGVQAFTDAGYIWQMGQPDDALMIRAGVDFVVK